MLIFHKAFGIGSVKGIDGGIIIFLFNGVEKKSKFPGGFENGI